MDSPNQALVRWKIVPCNSKCSHNITIQPGNPGNRYSPKSSENIHSHKDLYLTYFSSFIHSICKLEVPRSLSRGNWINRLWYIHTVEFIYYWIERNKLWLCATTWISLDSIMSCRQCQAKNIWNSRKVKTMVTETKSVVAQVGRGRGWMQKGGYKAIFCGYGNVIYVSPQ